MAIARTRGKPNFTEGPIFWRLLLFTLPIIASALLTTFYHMADNIVIGQFSGDENALAAIGQTSAYSSLLSNLVFGISGGGAVVVAQLFGANKREEMSRSIHTSISLAVIIGLVIMTFGLVFSRTILSLIIAEKNHAALLDKATRYMMIIALGNPALSLYSFGGAARRSMGDSKTPLIIGAASGMINVVLNLFFVIVCRMSVEGVAIATVVSQYLSAIAILIVLSRSKVEGGKFSFSKLCFDRSHASRILRYGVPSSVQFSMFSVANMLLASAVSTLPLTTINGVAIANSIDGITYSCMNGFTTAVMTFVGQNYGAGKKDRIWRSLHCGIAQVTTIGIGVATLELCFSRTLCALFIGDVANRIAVMEAARDVMFSILPLYFLCGIMSVMSGFLRGVGKSLMPMISSVTTVFTVRLTWIYAFFPMHPDSIQWLYLCFPITWALTCAINLVMIMMQRARLRELTPKVREDKKEAATA